VEVATVARVAAAAGGDGGTLDGEEARPALDAALTRYSKESAVEAVSRSRAHLSTIEEERGKWMQRGEGRRRWRAGEGIRGRRRRGGQGLLGLGAHGVRGSLTCMECCSSEQKLELLYTHTRKK